MWTKCEREKIKKLRNTALSISTRGMVIGTVLGDGCLRTLRNGSHLAYLKIGQKSKEFVKYKSDVLSQIIVPEMRDIQMGLYKSHVSYHINSISHPELYEIHSRMYKNGIKVITEDIFDELTIAGLLLWYFDDGYCNISARAYYLSTCNFSLEEHHLMRELLRKKFGLYTSIVKNNQYYKLYITRASTPLFEDYLHNFVPECMKYKCVFNIQSPQRLNVDPSNEVKIQSEHL